MATSVHLEHPVGDFDAWKAAFDQDPLNRAASGVISYRVVRPVDDPRFVAVDLEFTDRLSAARFRDALLGLWASSPAQAVMRNPVVRIEDVVEVGRPGV